MSDGTQGRTGWGAPYGRDSQSVRQDVVRAEALDLTIVYVRTSFVRRSSI